jgi:transposase
MRRIREVLRLKDECDLSYSQIARSLGISKGSVKNYLSAAEAAGLTHREAGLDDAALLARLHPQRYLCQKFAVPDFALVHRELKRKGVTLQLLWEEYRDAARGVPYSRSRFCERYLEFVRTLRRSMRQTHIAGEKLFVDYAGQTVPVVDPASGAERRTRVRRRLGGFQLHLRRGDLARNEGRLDRRARERLGLRRRRPSASGAG